MRKVERPWGHYEVIYRGFDLWVKKLTVNPGKALSLQYHDKRSELWYPLSDGLRGVINGSTLDLHPGMRYDVPIKVLHRITNPTDNAVEVIEVALGVVDEDDITRIHDFYGRP